MANRRQGMEIDVGGRVVYLSRREVEIARLVARGQSDKEIADELFISLRTATTHVHNMLAKAKAKNRTQFVYYVGRGRRIELGGDPAGSGACLESAWGPAKPPPAIT